MTVDQRVAEHYAKGDLVDAIRHALAAAGQDRDRLRLEDLAPIDEFHIRGREATRELGTALGLAPGMDVLDVGSGLGGASRHLAATFGCRITGIDLTPEYCRAATTLAEWVGLGNVVTYRQGSALATPFADAAFDAAYTQHVAMNIADKAALYREVSRVLGPGRLFGIYDILQGPSGNVLYPAPWARDPATSFLATPDGLRGLLEGAGFVIESWVDTTALGTAWFTAMRERVARKGPPALGYHIMLGADFKEMAANQVRNLNEGRIVLAQVICRKA